MKYWGLFGQYIIASLFTAIVWGIATPENLGGLIVYIFFLPAFMVGCTIIAFDLWLQIIISIFCIIVLPWYTNTFAPWYDDTVRFMFDPINAVIAAACLNLLFTITGLFYYPKHYYCQSQNVFYIYKQLRRGHILEYKNFFTKLLEKEQYDD